MLRQDQTLRCEVGEPIHERWLLKLSKAGQLTRRRGCHSDGVGCRIKHSEVGKYEESAAAAGTLPGPW